jgi:two-component system LytT family response regulator
VATVVRDHPDVVILDVQMPGLSGIEVAAALPADQRPAVIFVTAHERYAVEAFATRAVDYLLKPFDGDRLRQALQRARDQIHSQRDGDLALRLEQLLAAPPADVPERLAFKVDGRIVFHRPDEIVWIEAANNYSIVHLRVGKPMMVRETLGALEARLGPRHFVRANRSAVVHVGQVKELQPTRYGDYVVVLQDGLRIPLSRNLRGEVERFLPHAGS